MASNNIRIRDWATQNGLQNKEVIAALESFGFPGKTAASNLPQEAVERLVKHFKLKTAEKPASAPAKQEPKTAPAPSKPQAPVQQKPAPAPVKSQAPVQQKPAPAPVKPQAPVQQKPAPTPAKPGSGVPSRH